MRKSLIFKKGIIYLLCITISLIVAFPFIWMLLTSLKTYSDIFKIPITYFPKKITFEHYVSIFRTEKMHGYIINSIIISTGVVILSLLISILPAYSFGRFNFKNKKRLVPTIIFCMTLPPIVLVIPFLRILRALHLIDTHLGLILVYLTLTTPVAIWFLIGFFATIPKELDEAAMIDGCTRLQALVRIFIPIMRPGIAAVAIYAFFLSWNEFIFALSYLSSSSTLTLPVFLGRFVGQYQTRWGEIFAGSIVAYIVPLIAFGFLQKHFVSALARGAVKE